MEVCFRPYEYDIYSKSIYFLFNRTLELMIGYGLDKSMCQKYIHVNIKNSLSLYGKYWII
jgi:hypothetical protein